MGAALAAALVADRDRWMLWSPVLFGLGIAAYFAAPAEPPGWLALPPLLLALGGLWLGRRRPAAVAASLALALCAAGFAAVQLRAALVAAPVLERPSGKVAVSGIVEEVEPLAGGGQRVTLKDAEVAVEGARPHRVRLRLKGDEPVPVGARIAVTALLTPPPQPQMPGAFDFARHAWFQGLGAVGTALSPPVVIVPAAEGHWLNALRHRITLRILAAIPGSAGAVAAALVTGETGAIPRDVLDAYRDSGLAHMLSISGLHMGMVAGLVFFVVRGGLALVPAVALRHPIKKWAAAVALAATFLYMLLAGAPVPAQRSFLMTGIVLLAVLLDRSAISMRMVAWAALAVLALAPEALVGPSFQMSFAAVAALIAAFEVASPRLTAWRIEHPRLWQRAGLYLAGVALSSLVAGSATAVYGAYHFNRFAVWSLAANLAAVPLTGFLVMPFVPVALLLMPFGLEFLALVPMGWGVEAVNRLAAAIAAWPAAAVVLPPMPAWGLTLFTLGGLWLLLWRRRWRHGGWVAMVAGLATLALHQPPDVVVDGRGYAMAVRTADGALLVNRGGRILKETWDRRAGPLAAGRWPKRGRSEDGRLACDEVGCLYRGEGAVVALVQDEAGIAAGCAAAAVVVSAVPLRGACRGPAVVPRVVIDRFDLWRRGAHALWLEEGGARIETVAGWQGDRPWSHRPHRRRKRPDPMPMPIPEPVPVPEEPPAAEE
ncbi:ComEC/Rec2 family competence protein [Magnetospirillum sp. UT-4]|uniref:ComEC/Rec2 family competence protein n=1 Tax=Magnetospirillum sp. UT-4 TaxID=2681467 RepID=UPI0020C2BB99|nr:ComEC/Rec2 family competence protein [Magnetospirillum sp. UT-4]